MAHRAVASILGYVAQITFYVPDELARLLRRDAKRSGKSLSAHLTELVSGKGASRGFPDGFFELQGSCRGTLERPDDPPPEEP
jgi:hypothetical protein